MTRKQKLILYGALRRDMDTEAERSEDWTERAAVIETEMREELFGRYYDERT